MSFSKANLQALATQLSISNRTDWTEQLHKVGNAFGRVGSDIMMMKDPLPLNGLPDLHQLRSVGGVPMVDRYQFGTIAIDPQTNLPVVDANGRHVLNHTDAQLDAFDRLVAIHDADVEKINSAKSKLSYIMNNSISADSIAILKAAGLDRYSAAQSDPVLMLKLIEQTHKLTDDANMQAAINNVNACKQINFGSYVSFIAEFSRLCKIMKEMFIPTSATTTDQLIESIFKSFLINNVDQNQFSFILNSIHASTTPTTHEEVMQKLMNFSKTAMQVVIANPAMSRRSKQQALSAIGDIAAICIQCGERMKLKVNAQSGQAHQLCDLCYREVKLNRTAPERTFGHGPTKNMTRSEIQALEDKKKAAPKQITHAPERVPSISVNKTTKAIVRPIL